MPVGHDEPVPIGPLRVGGVVAQEIVPQDLGDVRHAHGHAGMAGIGGLHRVHTERANGVRKFSSIRHESSGSRAG